MSIRGKEKEAGYVSGGRRKGRIRDGRMEDASEKARKGGEEGERRAGQNTCCSNRNVLVGV